jgi:hypothetical protein
MHPGASRWILFTTIIVDARNHEPEINKISFASLSVLQILLKHSCLEWTQYTLAFSVFSYCRE